MRAKQQKKVIKKVYSRAKQFKHEVYEYYEKPELKLAWSYIIAHNKERTDSKCLRFWVKFSGTVERRKIERLTCQLRKRVRSTSLIALSLLDEDTRHNH